MESTKSVDSRMIVAAFDDRHKATRAVNDLEVAGFNDEEIGLVQRQAEKPVPGSNDPAAHGHPNSKGQVREPSDVAIAPDSNTFKRTTTGYVAGSVVGAVIGAAASLLVPGIGPVLAGGIIAGALVGASGGAAVGSIVGALTDLGLPESEARFYGTAFEGGQTLVTVRPGDRDRNAVALRILQAAGGQQATTPAEVTKESQADYSADS